MKREKDRTRYTQLLGHFFSTCIINSSKFVRFCKAIVAILVCMHYRRTITTYYLIGVLLLAKEKSVRISHTFQIHWWIFYGVKKPVTKLYLFMFICSMVIDIRYALVDFLPYNRFLMLDPKPIQVN